MATGFRNLTVYKKTFALAMDICHVSKKFPKDELYSVATQIKKSSRSVYSNTGEEYRKPLYEVHFASKISDSNDGFLITGFQILKSINSSVFRLPTAD